jgi:predicted metalloprotease with PDZ domain
LKIPLNECLSYIDVELVKTASPQSCESLYGFKTLDFGLNRKVSLIAPYSPSWKAGLSSGDEIIAVNGYTLKNDFNDWMQYFKESDIELTVSSSQYLKTIKLVKSSKPVTYFDLLKLKQKDINSKNYKRWIELNS